VYKFPMPGFGFSLTVSKNIPDHYRQRCLVHGPGNPIIASSLLEDLLMNDAASASSRESRPRPCRRRCSHPLQSLSLALFSSASLRQNTFHCCFAQFRCLAGSTRGPSAVRKRSLRTAQILPGQKGYLLFQRWHRLRAKRYVDVCPVIGAGLNVNSAKLQKFVGKLFDRLVDFQSIPLAIGAMHSAKFWSASPEPHCSGNRCVVEARNDWTSPISTHDRLRTAS